MKRSLIFVPLLSLLSAACGSTAMSPVQGTGGAAASGGAASGGNGAGTALGGSTDWSPGDASSVSGLPTPKTGPIARPAGSGASDFKILSWAGFQGAASYSIDDTQPSLFEHWDALKATGIRFTIYANPTSNWISGYDATLSEAVTLGHELGNHTMSHCHADLSGCAGVPPLTPVGTAGDEIDQCSTYITNLGQSEVWTIAYPYGDTSWKEISESRFLLGRGVSAGHIAPLGSTDPFNLPAVSASAGNTTDKFVGEIDAVRSEKSWVIFLYHSILPTTNNWYAGVDIGTITDSIAPAREAGDVWLDSVVNVGAYWVAEKLLAAAVSTPEGGGEKRTWTLPAHFPKGKFVRVSVAGGKLTQGGAELSCDEHGYYEVALDAGEVTWTP